MQRERTWAFFRSFYDDKDSGNVGGFLSHFSQSSQDVYQDAVLNLDFQGYDEIARMFPGFINAVSAKLGMGRFSKIFHVTGDMRYGAVAEYVDLKNTFYATNGITVQTVFDLDGGLIARDTDHWDSGELGASDISSARRSPTAWRCRLGPSIPASSGIDRTGLMGWTAPDLFGGRIQRMSVKFDTLQMGAEHCNSTKAALLAAGVVDQLLAG